MANSITFNNKVSLNPQAGVAAENKVTDADINEIKTVVNALVTSFNTLQDRTGILEGAANWGTFTGTTIADNVAQLKTILQTLETAIEAAGTSYTHPNHTGDVTSVGDGATTIAPNAVSNTKLADMVNGTVKARVTTGDGDPEDVAFNDFKNQLAIVPGDISGFDAAVSGNPSVTNNSGDITNLQTATGAADGTAHLGVFSDSILADNQPLKTLLQALSTAIQNIPTDGLNFIGVWDASLNSPAFATGTGTPGHMYIVSVAGTTDLDGIADWKIGDYLIADDSGSWIKINSYSTTSVQAVIDSNKRDPILLSGTANSSYSLSIAQVDAIITEMTGATYDANGFFTLTDTNAQKGMLYFGNDYVYEVITAGRLTARTARKDTTGGGGATISPLAGGSLQNIAVSSATPYQIGGAYGQTLFATGNKIRENTGDFSDDLTLGHAKPVSGDFTFQLTIRAIHTGVLTGCRAGIMWRAGTDPAGSNSAKDFAIVWQNQTVAMNGQLPQNINHRIQHYRTDQDSAFAEETNIVTNIQLPVTFEISRAGDVFNCRYSTDGGQNWTDPDIGTPNFSGVETTGFIGVVGLSNDAASLIQIETDSAIIT